jgi:hypothetical protein
MHQSRDREGAGKPLQMLRQKGQAALAVEAVLAREDFVPREVRPP